MTARTAIVHGRTVLWSGAGISRVRLMLDSDLRVSDAVLATVLTGFAVITDVRAPHPVSAAALAAVGTMSLAWRRRAPGVVLTVSAASLFGAELQSESRIVLTITVLIALYTVAVTHRVLTTAAASSLLLMAAVSCDVARHGWVISDFDDQFFAYILAIGAACVLGYAMQLSRTRVELARASEARLEAEHAGREQRLLQQEQARIARELHDIIAHQVCVITALAAGADRLILTEPARAKQVLNSIEAAGREALTEMRALLRVLRTDPGEVDRAPQPGLAQLPSLVEQMNLAGLPVRLDTEGQPRSLPVGVEVTAYRIVQQALTNTLKHAGPAHAEVLVRYRPLLLELDIRDDGRGMPVNPASGHGLIGMRERAALVGGFLLVGAGPAGGTRVLAELPAPTGQR
jgi:signal transduction histidine kinase